MQNTLLRYVMLCYVILFSKVQFKSFRSRLIHIMNKKSFQTFVLFCSRSLGSSKDQNSDQFSSCECVIIEYCI